MTALIISDRESGFVSGIVI